MGLLLPAVQKVRDAAARLSCGNNLKQMGLALLNFAFTCNGRLPAAVIHSGSAGPGGGTVGLYRGPEVNLKTADQGVYKVYNHTGFVALLPYIEQDPLFKQYSYYNLSSSSNPAGFTTLGSDPSPNFNRTIVANTVVKLYSCPADDNPPPEDTRPAGAGTDGQYERQAAVRSNYLFSSGAFWDNAGDYSSFQQGFGRGAFGNNGAASLVSMPDGTSNTIAIGESRQAHYDPNFGPIWGAGSATAVHGRVLNPNSVGAGTATVCSGINYASGGVNPTTVGNYCGGNLSATDARRFLQGPYQFGSRHTAGANFLFCDGSVRFLPDNTDIYVLYYLSTVDGAEPVSLP